MIRPASVNDLTAILDIMNDAILNSTSIYDYDARPAAYVNDWFAQKQSAGFPVLVYENNGAVAGYGTYGNFRPWQAYRFSVEHSIYVHKNHRGKGIGSVLLKALVYKATEEGYHTMIAGIDASNESSISFHKRAGFEEAGTIKEAGYNFDKWLDLVFMQLILKN